MRWLILAILFSGCVTLTPEEREQERQMQADYDAYIRKRFIRTHVWDPAAERFRDVIIDTGPPED